MDCNNNNCTDVATSCANSSGEPVGTTSADALACNASTIDKIVNETGFVTNRVGNQLNTLSKLESNYTITAINGGIWAAGQTFTAFNQYMVFGTTAYKPKVTTSLPYVVGVSPDLSFVEPVTVGLTGASKTFDFSITATLETLDDLDVLVVIDGLVSGDGFGGTFGATGLVDVLKSGTVDVDDLSIYGASGIQFKLIGNKVRFEALNLSYSTGATTVLGHIIALRTASYTPDVSPKYDVNVPFFGSDAFTRDWETSLHRGLATHNPENTELAFTLGQKTVPNGNKTFWEMDIQITSDNVAVVFHDETIDNLTTGTGTVTAMTLAQLQAVKIDRVVGTIFEEGVRIPTFEDIIKAASVIGVKIEIEMKNFSGLTEAKFKVMTDMVKKYSMSNSTTYSSFNIADLVVIKGLDSNGGLALASSTELANIADLETLRKLALGSNRQPVLSKSLLQWTDNPTDVAVCHSFGIDCIGYTADKGREMANMADIGIHKLHCNSNLR